MKVRHNLSDDVWKFLAEHAIGIALGGLTRSQHGSATSLEHCPGGLTSTWTYLAAF